MPRHPTVQVPNIGPMDHAWDLLGEWQAEFELPETEAPMHGKVMFRSWTDAELQLDPVEAAIAGIPSSVPLERASEIHLTDAGGGALQWVLYSTDSNDPHAVRGDFKLTEQADGHLHMECSWGPDLMASVAGQSHATLHP